jgi:hypothetical protein
MKVDADENLYATLQYELKCKGTDEVNIEVGCLQAVGLPRRLNFHGGTWQNRSAVETSRETPLGYHQHEFFAL